MSTALIRLAAKAVGQVDHYDAKINFLSRCNLRFIGKPLVDISLCGHRGWVGKTKTILKLISSVDEGCNLSVYLCPCF